VIWSFRRELRCYREFKSDSMALEELEDVVGFQIFEKSIVLMRF